MYILSFLSTIARVTFYFLSPTECFNSFSCAEYCELFSGRIFLAEKGVKSTDKNNKRLFLLPIFGKLSLIEKSNFSDMNVCLLLGKLLAKRNLINLWLHLVSSVLAKDRWEKKLHVLNAMTGYTTHILDKKSVCGRLATPWSCRSCATGYRSRIGRCMWGRN